MPKILLVEDSKFLRLGDRKSAGPGRLRRHHSRRWRGRRQESREHLPDLILLDVLLPKVTGTDVLKALKKDPATKGIAVVILTGMSQRNEDKLRRDGAFGFLGKSELALEKGSDALLAAVGKFVKQLDLQVPPPTFPKHEVRA